MKKVLLFFANGTEEVEALTPVDLLRRAGADVTVAGIGGETLVGSHGITVKADVNAENLSAVDKFDMIILPGGMPGTKNLDASAAVEKFLQSVDEDTFLAAICAAPMILGKRGLLKGRRAVCYPGFESFLDGAILPEKKVCRDGRFITAVGAGAAMEFALMLVSALFGAEMADELRKSVLAD